ncbi:MAG: lysophospholipid acyltransferase family protein [Syntrophobacterales bacterium]|nr:MAG: lysophospholipid acyltransferase family protein [Syntrophobacterales bacterium]
MIKRKIAKRFLRPLGKEIGWLILAKALALLKGDTDITTLYRMSEFMGRLSFAIIRSRRKLLLSNLHIVLPGSSEADINRIAKKITCNICRGFVDVFYHVYRPELLSSHVRLEENGVIKEVLSNGRGCIVATGHVGAFPWIGIPIVARGLPFAAIVRDPHDERVKKVFDDGHKRIGYINIPDRPPIITLKNTLKVLRKGGAVMIAFDMHPAHKGGITVDFLGRKTPMFSTVVRLAARTGVPIVPGHVLPEPDGMHHRVTYYPPIEVPHEAIDEDSLATREMLQRLADWLSGVIRNHPEQWWGIHRRWREYDIDDSDPQKS